MPLTDTAEEEKSIPRACEARMGDGMRDKATWKLHTCSRKTSSVLAVQDGMCELGVSGKSWKAVVDGPGGKAASSSSKSTLTSQMWAGMFTQKDGARLCGGPHQPLGDGLAPLATAWNRRAWWPGRQGSADSRGSQRISQRIIAANEPAVLPALWAGFRQQQCPICTFPGPLRGWVLSQSPQFT